MALSAFFSALIPRSDFDSLSAVNFVRHTAVQKFVATKERYDESRATVAQLCKRHTSNSKAEHNHLWSSRPHSQAFAVQGESPSHVLQASTGFGCDTPARPPVTPEVELPRRVSPLDHRGRWRRRWTEDPPGEVVAHQAGGQWIGLALAGRWCEDWGSWRRDLRGRAWEAWRLGSCAVILAECHATHITDVLVYKSGQNEADV